MYPVVGNSDPAGRKPREAERYRNNHSNLRKVVGQQRDGGSGKHKIPPQLTVATDDNLS